MTIRLLSSKKKESDIINADVLIERLKKARALNRGLEAICLSHFKCRNFLVSKNGSSGRF